MGGMAYDSEKAAFNPEHPENMPEIIREITMIRGALTAIDHRWEELVSKVSPVRMQRPEMVDSSVPVQDNLSVYSPIARELRAIYEEVGRWELRIVTLTGELGL
jgi:hypothetical protein